MQSQPNAPQKPMKATDRSIMIHSNISHTSTGSNRGNIGGGGATGSVSGGVSLLQPRRTAPATTHSSSADRNTSRQPSTSGNTSRHTSTSVNTPRDRNTEQNRTRQLKNKRGEGPGGKASTPTADSTTHVPEVVNLSAIGPPTHKHHSSSFNSPTLDESGFNMSSRGAAGRTRKGRGGHMPLRHTTGPHRFDFNSTGSSQDSAHHQKNRARDTPTTQLELDIQYARYLQWLYLNSSATHSFEHQEQQFMRTGFELCQEIENLRQQETDMKLKLGRLQHANRLDDALDTQEASLGPIEGVLPGLYGQHESLANALDTTRHQLPTKGVVIPDNEEHFQDNLQAAVEESEQLLNELNLMTRSYQPSLHNLSQALTTLQHTSANQVNELSRCGELLAAVDSLNTRECSLRIQHM